MVLLPSLSLALFSSIISGKLLLLFIPFCQICYSTRVRKRNSLWGCHYWSPLSITQDVDQGNLFLPHNFNVVDTQNLDLEVKATDDQERMLLHVLS